MHIQASADAPIACDMSSASDTPEERLREYEELFARSLLRRERTADAVVFSFRADARAAVEDLARREAACCPFLDYRVEDTTWTISDPGRRAAFVLDAFYDLGNPPVRAG
jgi:hypothetical protein